ncbi:VOC family protein [Dyella telluris]|uniref:VOC family protein n=1 Tax=Dyella telluris TaxID=2763498 RepID=A0A7G8Q5K4_9GAMM|nr:VOC family protein [Dyella telluris]QNK02062.1 VOC family protein [Dyella telluris]
MITNRSMPPGIIIPELAYPDVLVASAWLCRALGFRERLRIADHRVQLIYEGSSIVVTELMHEDRSVDHAHAVMMHVDDVDQHHARAVAADAKVLQPPTDYPYGERQYSLEDIGGHHWKFSQSIADVDPAQWGGELMTDTP